jgi:hypothetical protein
MSKSVMGGSVMKLAEPYPRRPGHTGIRRILARRSPWSALSRRIATKFNQTVGHIVGLVDFYTHPTAAQGSNPLVRSQSSGWPLSAHLPPCGPSRRRSLHPTDIGHSGLAAGTGLHAPFRPLPNATADVSGGWEAALSCSLWSLTPLRYDIRHTAHSTLPLVAQRAEVYHGP